MSEIFMLDTDMEEPCPCKCGEWFELGQGSKGKRGDIYCSKECVKEFESSGEELTCNCCAEELFFKDAVKGDKGSYCSDICKVLEEGEEEENDE